MGEDVAYIRLRNRHYAKPKDNIRLGQIAQIITTDIYQEQLENLIVYQIRKEDKHLVVLDLMKIFQKIHNHFPTLIMKPIGNSEIIIEILTPSMQKKTNIVLVGFVWLLLFIGSGLAIMNFHHDVSMQEVHQRIYYLLTGIEKKKPLLLQIPYSFGIGIGMILFFNHVFKKKINEEPSPLEVEMFLYQQNLDHYVMLNENRENKKEDKTK